MRLTPSTSLICTCLLLAGCPDDTPSTTEGDSSTGDATTMPTMTTVVTTDTPTTGADSTGTTGDPETGTTMEPETDSGTTEATDSGTTDATGTGSDSDSGTTGSTDSGSTDSGSTDSGSTDSGSTDSGSTDSGSSEGSTSTGGDPCGDGMVEMGEDCDGDDLDGSDCTNLGMGFTAGTLACDDTCTFDTSACTSVPWPLPGEAVISEIMQNPSELPDTDGEWFEVHNPGMTDLELGYCAVGGNMSNAGFVIEPALVVPAGGYVTLATDTMVGPGFTEDYQWSGAGFSLNNSADAVSISCDGMLIDEVAYDNGATFPDPNGASMTLSPDMLDTAANDDGANWCEGTSVFNGNDTGTPGAANDSCETYTIDFCRLQFPTVIDELEGTVVTAFGRLFIGGLTDLSGVNDPAPQVIGYVGYGPDGTDPAVDAGWVWVQGTPNMGYGPASPGYEANNDEYQADLTVPAAGDYDFAYRFSGDSGTTFTYCDGGAAGSSDGYAPVDAGQMTAN